MPTLVECDDIDACIRVAKENKLDFIEINMSFPQYQATSLSVEALRRSMRETGIFYTIHQDESFNPFDFNEKVSACYFDIMRDVIRFALKLDIPVINMHLLKGVYVTLPGKVILLTDVYADEYVEKVKRFIALCEEEIGDKPLKIAIENVDTNPFTESQLRVLPPFFNSPVFCLTLDVGHEMCLGYKDTHVFEEYPDKLLHMHLHDCDGKKPHLALGDGVMEIKEKLGLLRGDTCVIEVKTIAGLKESVQYLKEHELLK
jgi:sugar phosphate isomerase/epimerase